MFGRRRTPPAPPPAPMPASNSQAVLDDPDVRENLMRLRMAQAQVAAVTGWLEGHGLAAGAEPDA